MSGIKIRNHSKYPNLRAFVSKFSNDKGSHEWFPVPAEFDDDEESFWAREGWDCVVFDDEESKQRREWYLDSSNAVLEVTFFGFDEELGVDKHTE
ncbi:hypothetical protein FA15DRAFT_595576 [Coprinopsis marcescibilis]|uniref:Uncharacterized protein n=1 Tax=Coprinopsis marcescibilis TaxID=230819 RepID=A0A5C3KQA2_COPMA|nr:hypothetical protein FA15DRAFT_595576 [Coprinopsis marcescibilis]